MTAIADNSDIVTWSGSTWVVVLFLLLVGLLVWAFRREMQRAPLMDDQPSRLDEWDGVVAEQPRCWSSGPRGGHSYASAVDGVRTCLRCGDTVSIPRWQS